jgi:hypothetical protein
VPEVSEHDRALAALRQLKYYLDEVFRIPGTGIRVGWDPIVGAVPWVGDLLTALLSGAIVVQAHRMRVPRIVQMRMLLNIGIDLLIGVVPLAGDIADVFWKSNTRNFALLERHAGDIRPATAGDWAFVAGIALMLLALAMIPLLVLYWVVYALPAHLPPLTR